jgi:AraC family transcriptional regulator
MESRIEDLKPKKLAGYRSQMTIANDLTESLWQKLMPLRNEIPNRVGENLYSVQVFDPTLTFASFNSGTVFEKWAAVEVSSFDNLTGGMEKLEIPGGLYAIFHYKGTHEAFREAANYIFGTWLPKSGYEMDVRPHFDIMGPKYKRDSSDSEEDIFIPVKKAGSL